MRLCLFLLFAAGCNCFHPVEELDGGTGGGTAGGGTAGGSAGGGMAGGATAGGSGTGGGSTCTTAADCTGARPAMSLCSNVFADGGFSCLDRVCTFECQPGRACSTSADAGCLDCTGAARQCEPGPAGCGTTLAAVVEASTTCPVALTTDLTLTPIPGTCGWTVTDTINGRTLGTVYRLADYSYVAQLPELGGTCVGVSLATHVERWLLSCPACQFELRL